MFAQNSEVCRIGNRLRILRTARHLSMDELASAANISKSTISAIESHRQSPTASTLEKLAKALDISAAEFHTDTPSDVVIPKVKRGRRPKVRQGLSEEEAYLLATIREQDRPYYETILATCKLSPRDRLYIREAIAAFSAYLESRAYQRRTKDI